MATLTEHYDVVIVGAGPVGLFLAIDLAQRNITSIIVEKRLRTSNSARAILLNSRTMELLRSVGLEATIQDHSYPRYQPVAVAFGTSIFGPKLIDKKFASWGDAVDGKRDQSMLFGFNNNDTACPALFCPQLVQESVLVDYLAARKENTIDWGFTATDLSQSDDGIVLKAVSCNTEKTVIAQYAVGCDGGKSWVRKQLKIHNIGQFVVQRACSITFRSPELEKLIIQSNQFGFTLVLNKKAKGVIVALGNHGLFAFHTVVPPSTTDERLAEICSNAKQHVLNAVGKDVEVVILDTSHYNMHCLVATKFFEGRVCLAGDAAHQWLPVRGLGLNTGYQDAHNLAWKLAAMCQGWGGKYLLESYNVERWPIADIARRFALESGHGVRHPIATNAICKLISNAPVRLLIKALLAPFLKGDFDANLGIILGYQYSKSNVIVHELDKNGSIKKPIDQGGKFCAVSLPGCRAPHVAIPGYVTIHDVLGRGFVLLVIGAQRTHCKMLQEALTARGVPFDILELPQFSDLVKIYDHQYYFIRPDMFIVWRSNTQPNMVEACEIVSIACGDVQYQFSPTEVQSISLPVSRHVIVSMFVSLCLHKFTNLSLIRVCLAGMCAISVFTILCNKRKHHFAQQISRHCAWVLKGYGSANKVLHLEPKKVASFKDTDVVIKVHAASVTPLDCEMRNGIGKNILGTKFESLILGRDCSGEIVAVGDEVCKMAIGNEVVAAVPFNCQGTHSQYVAVNADHVAIKPRNISHAQAATLPTNVLAVWEALVSEAGLTEDAVCCKHVLVHGIRGGITMLAIQLLEHWGAKVSTTQPCGPSISYISPLDLMSNQKYDIVLNTTGEDEDILLDVLKEFSDAKYISLVSPYVYFTDALGPFLGSLVYQWYYRYKIFSKKIFSGICYHYSSLWLLQPNGTVLHKVREMVEKNILVPDVEGVYPMEDMIMAQNAAEHNLTGYGSIVVVMH